MRVARLVAGSRVVTHPRAPIPFPAREAGASAAELTARSAPVISSDGPMTAAVLASLPDAAIARFEALFTPSDDGACWPWLGHRSPDGYGIMSIGIRGRRACVRAHRIAYTIYVGPTDPTLVIDHVCRNRLCVNPAHLEQVTASENVHRGRRSRLACGRGHAYTPENTGRLRVGPYTDQRYCKECRRIRDRACRQARTQGEAQA